MWIYAHNRKQIIDVEFKRRENRLEKAINDNNMSKERRQASSANKMMLRFSGALFFKQSLHVMRRNKGERNVKTTERKTIEHKSKQIECDCKRTKTKQPTKSIGSFCSDDRLNMQ